MSMLHMCRGSQIGTLCACLGASLSPSLSMGSLALPQPRPLGLSSLCKEAPHMDTQGPGSDPFQGVLEPDILSEVIEEGDQILAALPY